MIDFGVCYSTSGRPLVRVMSSPKRGQYLFNVKTGKYTFSKHDRNITINFTYTGRGTNVRICPK